MRIRPPLSATDPGFDLIPQRFRGSVCQVLSDTSLAVESTQGKKVFVFDRVFGQDVDQEGVWDYVSDSVGSFLQGYNVSLLAYGQSGAGKSYTVGTTGSAEQSNQELAGAWINEDAYGTVKTCMPARNVLSANMIDRDNTSCGYHSFSETGNDRSPRQTVGFPVESSKSSAVFHVYSLTGLELDVVQTEIYGEELAAEGQLCRGTDNGITFDRAG